MKRVRNYRWGPRRWHSNQRWGMTIHLQDQKRCIIAMTERSNVHRPSPSSSHNKRRGKELTWRLIDVCVSLKLKQPIGAIDLCFWFDCFFCIVSSVILGVFRHVHSSQQRMMEWRQSADVSFTQIYVYVLVSPCFALCLRSSFRRSAAWLTGWWDWIFICVVVFTVVPGTINKY